MKFCWRTSLLLLSGLYRLVINPILLVIQDEGVIANTAFHQISAQARRVNMNLVLLQLDRSDRCRGMGNHKAEVFRDAVRRDLDDAAPIQHADHTKLPLLLTDVGLHSDIGVTLHQLVDGRRNHEDAVGL